MWIICKNVSIYGKGDIKDLRFREHLRELNFISEIYSDLQLSKSSLSIEFLQITGLECGNINIIEDNSNFIDVGTMNNTKII